VNDILLTPEDIKREEGAALDAWTALDEDEKYGPIGSTEIADTEERAWDAFRNQWLCRAQVQKVVEWWTSPCLEHAIPTCVVGPVMDRMDCTECLAALKAAGGEG
jgi:hypothetical protein